MKKILVVMLVLAVLFLTACTNKSGTEDQITFIYWTDRALTSKIERIKEETDLNIEAIDSPGIMYMPRLMVMIAVSDFPDIFTLPEEPFYDMAENGLLHQLEIDGLEIGEIETVSYEGEVYGLRDREVIYVVSKFTENYPLVLEFLEELFVTTQVY